MSRLKKCRFVAFLFAFLIIGVVAAQAPEPEEPGVRLRAYWIGEPVEGLYPLRPGETPNVDVTAPSLNMSNGAPPFSGADDEMFDRHYVIEMTGTILIESPGEYEWKVGSTSAVRVYIDDQRLTDPTGPPTWKRASVHLDKGPHRLRIVQWVNEPNERFMNHQWRVPGTEEFVDISTDVLRAPAFYFRPTQPGQKVLAMGGDRPGLRMKLDRVHPGYRVVNIRPDGMEMPVGALGQLSDGRLVVARFDATTLKAPRPTETPNGQLWLLSNVDGADTDKPEGDMIADGLFEPSGICVLDDVIYVSQRREVSCFQYDNATDAWRKSVVASGWETNDFHQISAGLLHEPGPDKQHPGYLYMARSPGLGLMQNPPNHGSVWRIDLSKPAGDNVTPLTGGHRTPNGIGYGPGREIFVIDNQGEWTPANELNHVQQGKFYGFYHGHNPPRAYKTPFQPENRETGEVTQAAVLLPQDEIGNSPTQPLLFPADHAFAGQLALPDMRYGGVNRVFLEQVEGVWQGCVMRFTQGLEAGPNRIFFGRDGSLYVGGIGGRHASTWYWVNAAGEPTYQGLERLIPTGEQAFEIDHMRATETGFVLAFTQPVAAAFLEQPENYALKQWTYRATSGYGGPKVDLGELEVTQAIASNDGLEVRLVVPGLKPGYVVYLATDPTSRDGQAIWSGEVWYTLNRIPDSD